MNTKNRKGTPRSANSKQQNDYITAKTKIKIMIKNATKKTPVTREELSMLSGVSDRMVRNMIQELRDEGCWFAHYNKGYFHATSEEDRNMLINDYISRIKHMSMTVKALESGAEGQEVMDIEKIL